MLCVYLQTSEAALFLEEGVDTRNVPDETAAT